MITVFAYQAVQWKDGKPLEATAPAIGFTDTVPNHGITIGTIRPSKKSGSHHFFLETKPGKIGLSAASLRTITDKLDYLNAKAVPRKESNFNWKGRKDLDGKRRIEIEKSQAFGSTTRN